MRAPRVCASNPTCPMSRCARIFSVEQVVTAEVAAVRRKHSRTRSRMILVLEERCRGGAAPGSYA